MRQPPLWIQELKPGEYETKELEKITGKWGPSLVQTLKKYGATIKKVPAGYRNLIKNIYIWEGYKPK